MFFRYLNYRKSKRVQVLGKSYGREPKPGIKIISPPPPYGAVFNRNRFMTGSDLFYGQNPDKPVDTNVAKKDRKVINGRDYMVVREQGMSRLVPMRVPSAALFQYSYTN